MRKNSPFLKQFLSCHPELSFETVYGLIYKITCSINRKVYIGQTRDSVERRWDDHRSSDSKIGFQAAVRKYGTVNFLVEVVDYAENQEDLNKKEMHWISLLDTMSPKGYNLTGGGDGFSSVSEETRKRRGDALKGHPTPQETRDKISAAQKGRPLSPEHREALRSASRKPQSQEDLDRRRESIRKSYRDRSVEITAKISKVHVGRKNSEATIAKMRSSALARCEKKKQENSSNTQETEG